MRTTLLVVPIALAALFAAPNAEALTHRIDITVPPSFLPSVELSDSSRLTVTRQGDTVYLDGVVSHRLEHFLAVRAVAAHHGGPERLVDRAIVLPPPPAGTR